MPGMLSGLTVMVTRPAPAGATLCELIKTAGGDAIYFPTIAFAPADEKNFAAAVTKLGEQDWLIFISPQAVYASIPAIRRAWPHLPPQVKLAAVGAGTAQALHEAGYQVSVYPDTEWNSEGLLALPAFQHAAGQKIAIIRGEGGRELIDQQLTERGAQVLHVIAYQRVLPDADVTLILPLLNEHNIDRIICGSYTSVQNLKILLGEPAWPDLRSIPLIVMSARIKMLANNLGFQTIWVAQNAGHAAVIEMLSL